VVRSLPCIDWTLCVSVWLKVIAERQGVAKIYRVMCYKLHPTVETVVGRSRRKQRHGFVFIVFLLGKEYQNTKITHSV